MIPPQRHAFTVDLEDWHHGIPIDAAAKAAAEPRLDRGVDRLLDLMAERSVLGTFFILGPIARDNPDLVRRIAAGGHEIGCHGWSHDLLYTMTPARFREETRQATATLEDVIGQPVTAYRAAYFSITKASLWAFEELAAQGYRYDSSVVPARNWRYGIEDFDPRPQRVDTPAGPILELPISVRRLGPRTMPASGGAYFRIYPYWLSAANFRASAAAGRPIVFYLHPWELDPDHPRVRFYWKAHLTHYWNLPSTEPRLRRLLDEFRFAPLGTVLDHEIARSRS